MELVVYLSLVALFSICDADDPCIGKCFPGGGKYEGKLIAVDDELADAGYPSSLQVLDYFAYDVQGQKFYGVGKTWDQTGHQQTVEILQLNDEDPPVEYVVIDGKCDENEPAMARIACVSDKAIHVGDMTLGSPQSGEDSLEVHVYASHSAWDDSPKTKTGGTVHVLTEDCYPVFYSTEGIDPEGHDRMVSFLVGDFHGGIDNQTVFAKPSECN